MTDLISIRSVEDIPISLRETPIGYLLKYHNLDFPFEAYSTAQLLVGMCMDNRKQLHIPENFAYIIRSGGGNLRESEFKVSYAVAVGGVRAIALICHTQCGMVDLRARRDLFIDGLVEGAGWDRAQAADHFDQFAPKFEIGEELTFTRSEAKRLRGRYPKILIVPMMYRVEDSLLYLISETSF